MVVSPGDGPLVIEGGDELWPLLVKQAIRPELYSNLDYVEYLQELIYEDGVDPRTGPHILGYQYMPKNMSFFGADPANGEPRPDDAADTYNGENYRFVNCGHRFALRGLISAFMEDTLNVDFQVRWGDGVSRQASDTRGAWTGAVLSLLNGATMDADYLAYCLHGKRVGDANWEHRGSLVDSPIAGYTPTTVVAGPWNSVDSGETRILITGGPPAWTVKTQYWDPGIPDWVDISTQVVDLQNYAVPGSEDQFAMFGYLFHGATKHLPGVVPSPAPYQDTYFPKVSISQFTPFVLDMIDWSAREKEEKTEWLTGLPAWWDAPLEIKIPATDIVTWPEGSTYGPEKIREFDADEQLWGVKFLPDTILAMSAIEDRKFLTRTNLAGKYEPVCLFDVDALGPSLPFAYVGRYKLDDPASWGEERCLVSFGDAGSGAAPGPSTNGMGITWREANGGELVLKYWDGVAAGWLELTAPLLIEDCGDQLVEIGVAWTGLRGSLIGLPDNELRIVVDGVTLASVVEPNLQTVGTYLSNIGSGAPHQRHSFKGMWYGGASFIESASNNDLLHAFEEPSEGGFENPSFEIEAESGRPGEAEDWQWDSFQGIGGWADFSAYREDLAPYRYGREGFDGGWLRGYAWMYADETARLAAIGFTADDVGKAAWQLDTNENFILANHSPIAWVRSEVGENQGWWNELLITAIAAAVFNEGIPSYETTMEIFQIWDGLPWLDAYNLIPPCLDTLGPYGGPTGFDGWYDAVLGTNLDSLCAEDFEEAWGNDPFSTASSYQWYPGTANGILRGDPIEVSTETPLVIPPNKNQLCFISDILSQPILFSLPSAEYTSLNKLRDDLNAAMTPLLPAGSGLEWQRWKDGPIPGNGLTFGWDGSTLGPLWFGFAAVDSMMSKDLRGILGMRGFSPGGNYTGVGIPAWIYPALPAGVDADDRFLFDTWSYTEYFPVTDPYLGLMLLEYGQVGAIFDSAVPDPTYMERFTLEGWVSPSAVWITDLSMVSLTQAMFDGGTEPLEQFIDTEWPDEMFPT